MKVQAVFRVCADEDGCWVYELTDLSTLSSDQLLCFYSRTHNVFVGTREKFVNHYWPYGKFSGYIIEEVQVGETVEELSPPEDD